ncbi:MAG: trigger factor [Bacteroidales bacterium]
MKVTHESTGELTATVKIEVSPGDYNEQVTKVLKDYQRKANVPGFRPGKVPFGMIKKMYGSGVFAEELNKLLSDSLNNYITDNHIDILGQPLANDDRTPQFDGDEEKILEFYFDLGLMPEFKVDISENTAVEYCKVIVDDKMVENYMDDIARRNGMPINPEVSEAADMLKGEFAEITEEGQLTENGHTCTNSFSTDQLIEDTEKAKFLGLKAGDSVDFNPSKAIGNVTNVAKLLDLDKADDAHLQADYRFTLQEITRTEPAAINQELFDKVYPEGEVKSVEEFRERIRTEAGVAFEADTDKQFLNDVVKKLIEDSKMVLPVDFMKRWLFDNNQGKLTREQIESDFDNFANSMKWQLIENKIIKEHDVVVSDQEIKDYIIGYFKPRNSEAEMDPEMVKRFDSIATTIMQNKEEVHKINDKLYEQKLITLLKNSLKLVEKEVTYEEFITLASANH